MINLRYRLPANLENTASVTAAADWMLVQKDGEEFLSKIPAGTFGPMLASSISGLDDTNTGIAFPGGDVIQFVEGAAECARFTADGEFSIGGGALLKRPGQGATTLPVYSFSADTDTGIANPAANELGIIAGGTVRCLVGASGNFRPGVADTYYCGTSAFPWLGVYGKDAYVATSDGRLKTDVVDSDLGLSFIATLRPVSFRWRETGQVDAQGTPSQRPGVRPHYGLIAQEVRQALDGLGHDDFAGYCYDADDDTYALRYSEFIAPLIKAVQELAARVEELEAQLGV